MTTEPRSVTVDQLVDVPAADLWSLVADFEHIDRWSDLEVRAIDGHGIGSVRTVAMAAGQVVQERLLAWDPVAMTLVYEALEPNPFPMRNYRSTLTIAALGAQSSRILWSGSYSPPDGFDPQKSDRLLQKVYLNGIELLARYFGRNPGGKSAA